MARFPNAATLVIAHLSTTLGVRVVTRLPGTLTAAMPLVRITVAGGSDDGLNDEPVVDVEAFAASEGAMWTLIEDAREAMHDLAGRAVGGKLVDSVGTIARPFWLDYENKDVHRAVSTYRLTLRLQ